MMNGNLLDAARRSVEFTEWYVQLTAPSVLAVGEPFCLRITVFAPDGMPSGNLNRVLQFVDAPGIEGLPDRIRLDAASDGCITLEGLHAAAPGNTIVTASPEESSLSTSSNPIRIEEEPAYRVFWGDLHVHTTYSNCGAWRSKDPEFCYAYARDASCLDFAAAADHLRGIRAEPERWPGLQALAREYNVPGRFATLLAFESSHQTGFGGDINAYFLDDDAPYFWSDHEGMQSPTPAVPLRVLWDFLDSTGKTYCTAPHHTGRANKYRDFSDPAYDAGREAFFEIYSGWGSSERRNTMFPLYGGNSTKPSFFEDALLNGCRYGVICSSDDHTTTPGGQTMPPAVPFGFKRLAGPVHRGLAAVMAPELTREALWDALTHRRSYGTTYARTLLDFTLNDMRMGMETTVSAGDELRHERNLRVQIHAGNARNIRATLVRNGKDLLVEKLPANNRPVAFVDRDPLDEIAIRDAVHHPAPFVCYYVRVEDQFSQTQWSSPIWLDMA